MVKEPERLAMMASGGQAVGFSAMAAMARTPRQGGAAAEPLDRRAELFASEVAILSAQR